MNEHPIITLIRSKLTDPAKPFILLADFDAKSGKADDIARAVVGSNVVALSQQEAGCDFYNITRDADAPHRFTAVERWKNLAALDAHLATPHFAAVGAALAESVEGQPSLRVLLPID